jgi:hypothetical protein
MDEADRYKVDESSKQRVETSKGGFKLTKNIFSATTHTSCCHSPLVVVDKKKKKGLRPRHPATCTCC